MNINDLYDRIVLINLVERPDKLEHAKKQLEFANITNYDIYSAVKFDWSGAISMLMTLNKCGQFNYNTNPNEFSCALSHYNVIKKAYLEGVERLFIFEDDICFHNDYNKYISSYLNNLPSDTNLLMLSGFICDDNVPPLEKINDYWKKPKYMWYACSYGLDRKGMKLYLDMQNELLQQADMPLYLMQVNESIVSCCPNVPLIVQANYLSSDLRETKNFEENPNYYELGIDYNNYLNYYSK